MNLKFVKTGVVAAVTIFALSVSAEQAEGVWSHYKWNNPESGIVVPAEGNLILNRRPTYFSNMTVRPASSSTGTESTSTTVMSLSDGLDGTLRANLVGILDYAIITYEFDDPVCVREIRIHTGNWGGRSKVSVSSVQAETVLGEQITLGRTTISPSDNYNTAILAMEDDSPLCDCVRAVTINFGKQDNARVGYGEIEIIGGRGSYCVVETSPSSLLATTPSLGSHKIKFGQPMTFSAPLGPVEGRLGTLSCICQGYTIKYDDGTSESGESNSVTITPTQGFTLTWNYETSEIPNAVPVSKQLAGRYVQKGLVACYDAIYNQGTNAEHAALLTDGWADLDGRQVLAPITTAIPSVTENQIVWNGVAAGEALAYNTVGVTDPLFASNSYLTVELIGECMPWGGNNTGVFSLLDGEGTSYGSPAFGLRFAGSGFYYSTGNGGQVGVTMLSWQQDEEPLGFCYASMVNGDGSISHYYNAKLWQALTTKVAKKENLVAFVLGGQGTNPMCGGAKFSLYGTRLYSRTLSEDELHYNSLIDSMRYVNDDCVFDQHLAVSGDTGNFGRSLPQYGATTLVRSGEDLFISVEDELATYPDGVLAQYISSNSRAKPNGWEYRVRGQVVASDDTTSATIVPQRTEFGESELIWKWVREFQVQASTIFSGCKVQIGEDDASEDVTSWVGAGVVRLQAIPGEGMVFERWMGDVDGIADVTAADTTLTVSGGVSIRAQFKEAHHEPVTIRLLPGKSGDWSNKSIWEGEAVPQEGDTVLLVAAEGEAPIVTISESTPRLAKLVISNNVGAISASLVCSKWDTLISADEVVVGQGGEIRSAGGFYETSMSNRVWISANTLTVDEGGTINADCAGWAPGNGPCWQKTSPVTRNGTAAAAYGGLCGDNDSGIVAFGPKCAQPYGDVVWPFDPGCGHGEPDYTGVGLEQSGGGAIYLNVTGALQIDGLVTACGTFGASGGGSGGGIVLCCETISGTGEVTASAASDSSKRFGGSGGRIAVHYDAAAQTAVLDDCSVAFLASGGIAGNGGVAGRALGTGAPGTLWFPDDQLLKGAGYADDFRFSGLVHIGDNVSVLDLSSVDIKMMIGGQLSFVPDSEVTVKSFSIFGESMYGSALLLSNIEFKVLQNVVVSQAWVRVRGGSFSVDGNLRLAGGLDGYEAGQLRIDASSIARKGTVGVECIVGGDILIETNAILRLGSEPKVGTIPHVTAKNFMLDYGGLVDSSGLGRDTDGPGKVYGTGTSYGGRGASDRDLSDHIYGDEKWPLDPGSGYESRSGGVVYLTIKGNARLNGTIRADGEEKQVGAVGTGGSVCLSIGRLLKSKGTITANGAYSTYYSSGAGRIAIYCYGYDPRKTMTIEARAKPCQAQYQATDGSVYIKVKPIGTVFFIR